MKSTPLHILQHSLGLDKYGQGDQFRNHFVTGPGSDDYPICRQLVADGLMIEHPPRQISGGDPIFTVTVAGMDFVKTNSPTPKKATEEQWIHAFFMRPDVFNLEQLRLASPINSKTYADATAELKQKAKAFGLTPEHITD